jgi:hypothetical protein
MNKRFLLSVLPLALTLVGCGGTSATSTVSGHAVQHYEMPLSLGTYKTYISEAGTKTASSMQDMSISYSGVLGYALYKDVKVTVTIKCTDGRDSGGTMPDATFTQDVTLNAAGGGVCSIPFSTMIPNRTYNVSSYVRTMETTAVTGTVIFDI